MLYIKRQLESQLETCLRNFPVTLLTGPRQTGKTLLLRHFLKDYEYISFDDFKARSAFAADPKLFMSQYGNKVIIDEAQKASGLFEYLQKMYQSRHARSKFVLISPVQFPKVKNLLKQFSDNMGLLSLLPFQYM